MFYLDNGAVEIQKGSEIDNYRIPHDYHNYDDLYNELLDDGIIEETESGAIFVENYTFYTKFDGSTALSGSAGFMLIASRNGKDYWLDESNHSINKNEL